MDKLSKPIQLQCCCCGRGTMGRQWWNRDKGFGLCDKCADLIEEKEGEEILHSMAGVEGIHYRLVETPAEDYSQFDKHDVRKFAELY